MDKKVKIILAGIVIFCFLVKYNPLFIIKVLNEIDSYLFLAFGIKKGVFPAIAGLASGFIMSHLSLFVSEKIAYFLISLSDVLILESDIICISYISKLKERSEKLKEVILILSGYFFFFSMFVQSGRVFFDLFFLLFLLFLILTIKEFFIEYRIQTGLFGTNRTEARELIDFIIKNSDNLDFTDSNGNLRRALLPEAKDTAEEHIPGTLGEEAPA